MVSFVFCHMIKLLTEQRLCGRDWSGNPVASVIKALSQDSLRLIKDILANPHPTTPYEVLKDRLLNNHSLTDFQKIERQFKIGELGPQQKPSELLAHLVELTPADELESKYLIFLFIQRLPKILRMQLGDKHVTTWT
jgi:hypothetical protein